MRTGKVSFLNVKLVFLKFGIAKIYSTLVDTMSMDLFSLPREVRNLATRYLFFSQALFFFVVLEKVFGHPHVVFSDETVRDYWT